MTKRFLIGKHDRIVRTDTYLVSVMLADGRKLENLEPRRLFPYTMPDRYITLLTGGEREEALIPSLDELDENSRHAIEECLEEYYLIPRIMEVLHIEDKAGAFKWQVMTERGQVEFSIQNRHSDIKDIGTRLFIRDSNDNRYYIELAALDEKSMRKLSSYL